MGENLVFRSLRYRNPEPYRGTHQHNGTHKEEPAKNLSRLRKVLGPHESSCILVFLLEDNNRNHDADDAKQQDKNAKEVHPTVSTLMRCYQTLHDVRLDPSVIDNRLANLGLLGCLLDPDYELNYHFNLDETNEYFEDGGHENNDQVEVARSTDNEERDIDPFHGHQQRQCIEHAQWEHTPLALPHQVSPYIVQAEAKQEDEEGQTDVGGDADPDYLIVL